MAHYFSGEFNKAKIVLVFFIVFAAVAAYAATELSKTVRPMTLEEYEKQGTRRPAPPAAFFDSLAPFFIQ
ncbi:MAG: hypothetical protein NUV61_02855 [Candidatus Azambacteria bacterium]|nr:hypothetical protein [Candidatus Azambacteria bacterium]